MDICRLSTHGALPDCPYILSIHQSAMPVCLYILSIHLYIISIALYIPSIYLILYIRCNSLPPRVRPVGVGMLPPHAKAINIGYKRAMAW